MIENEKPTQLLSAGDLEQVLRVSRRQVFRLKSCGKLPPPVRVGGSVGWLQSDIAYWLVLGRPDYIDFIRRRTVDAINDAWTRILRRNGRQP